MKTALAIMLLFGFITLSAQEGFVPGRYELSKDPNSKTQIPNSKLQISNFKHQTPKLKFQNSEKAPGDTIFYEDFDSARWGATCNSNYEPVPENAPEGYTIHDAQDGGWDWRWSDVGPRGAYTSPGEDCHVPSVEIFSTTKENGFLMIEADWHFTDPETCTLIDIYTTQNSWVEYSSIDFTGYDVVYLRLEQFSRFCCGYDSESNSFLELSTDDGNTWERIDVSPTPINRSSTNPSILNLDLSSYVANTPNVMFRFHFVGLNHYHWEIDDVLFYEPYNYNLTLNDVWEDYMTERPLSVKTVSSTYNFYGGLYQIPWFTMHPFVNYRAAIENAGSEPFEDVVYNVDVYANNDFWVKHTSNPFSVAPASSDTFSVDFHNSPDADIFEEYYILFDTAWLINDLDNFRVEHYLTSANQDDNISNDTIINSFQITDTIIGYANPDQLNGTISPDRFNDSITDGDALGFEILMPDTKYFDPQGLNPYYLLSSVGVFIPEQAEEVMELINDGGVYLVAKIFDRAGDGSINEEPVISSSLYYLNAVQINQWVTVPLLLDGFSEYVYEGGSFIIMLEFYGTYETDRIRTFEIGEDVSHKVPGYYACKLRHGEEWSWGQGCPAITLSMTYTGSIGGNCGGGCYCEFQLGSCFHVTNAENEPIPTAQIEIEDETYSVDSLGNLYLPLATCHNYHYTISAEGYNDFVGSKIITSTDTIRVVLNHVGVEECQDEELSIYPNPCKKELTIEANGEYGLRISNVVGEIVCDSKMKDIIYVNTESYIPGVYFVHLSNDKEQFVRRVIVE